MFTWQRRPWWRHGLSAVLLGTFIVAAVGDSASAQVPQPLLRLKRIRPPRGTTEPLKVQVSVSSRVPLGAYTFQLSFDSSALELLNIDGGAADFAAAPFTDPQRFGAGVVRFSGFQPLRMDGPIGRCHLATLYFRPRTPRGRTQVDVEVVTLADTVGSTYHPRARRKRVSWNTR